MNIKLIRGKENDTLCILMNHMLCDAAGFKEYLYMFSDIYLNIENNQCYQIMSERNRKIRQILKNFSVTDKLRIMLSKFNIFTYDNVKFQLDGGS
ncbi:hypothetical protein [Clostridium beijerinckii]|uniref:hypothetical protein n=1 Tax=Clostridium beijerinckii TaxID=1520 RepID=UPI001FA71C38|nr:hypothetical protein [Clostridium beijerinckii]